MESLHYGKILGEDRTNIGFCWEIATGIYYANLGGEGVAVDGDAEPSTASGGCSEAEHPQRSKKSSKRAARRFFRAPQGGKDCDLPRSEAQKVTLLSLWVEQAAICPVGPSPATGEGDGEGADAPAATLGAYLCAVRIWIFRPRKIQIRIQHCKRQKGVRQGGICPP